MNIISIDIVGGPHFYNNGIEWYQFIIALIPLFFVLIINWIFKIKASTLLTKEKHDFGNYVLSFDNENSQVANQIEQKKLSVLTKIFIVFLSLIVILTPSYELLEHVPNWMSSSLIIQIFDN